MKSLDYVLADVFTRKPFSGNPLAVFPAVASLSATTMQAIAAELNLSETVFVFSPKSEKTTFDARIFTPRAELPFAGHPTVGTALVLDALGFTMVGGNGGARPDTFVLGLKFGPTRIRLSDTRDGRTAELTSPQIPTRVSDGIDRETAAAMLGLLPDDVSSDLPISGYSAGNGFLFVPLSSREALSKVLFQTGIWAERLASSETPHVLAFVVTSSSGELEIAQRMFAPLMGISEDPATGAAAVAMGGYLYDNRFVPADGCRWRIHQGAEMGRPSLMVLDLEVASGRLSAVRLSGSAVLIGRGSIDIASVDEADAS